MDAASGAKNMNYDDIDERQRKQLNEYLQQFVTEEKMQKMQKVLEQRTRKLNIVLEDIYQPHNASACIRSCEIFGVQNLHVIENRNKFEVNLGVAMGSSKWVDVKRWRKSENNTSECLKQLKKDGYRIVATALREDANPLPELKLDGKIALVFGTEEEGISDLALEHADETMIIPMSGFTQSFNISVSVALCLYDLSNRIRKETDDWKLSEEEQEELLYNWVRKVVRNPDIHIKEFLKNNPLDS